MKAETPHTSYVARFSDGHTPGSRDVRVRLTDRGVTLELAGEAQPLVWPYGALAASEPLGDHAIDALLTYAYQPGAALFVADARFARHLAKLAPHLTARSRRWRAAQPWLWAAALAGLVLLGGWIAGLSPSRAIARMLPDTAREALGDQVVASMTRNKAVCSAPDGVAALDVLTGKLSKAAGGDRRFKVVVVDWDLMNAFATPGEKIVLTRGLIAKAKSPDEVAGVLAHEMGHGIEMHPETGLVRSIGLAAGLELVLGGAGGALTNVGLMLAQLSYSREAEREADEHALNLLRGASISPDGLLNFFDRVREMEEKQGGPGLDVLRSHPQTAERRERVARAQHYDSFPALDTGAWEALQGICAGAPSPAPAQRTHPLPGETDT
jgi:Zn-dependent protease with chaperone function